GGAVEPVDGSELADDVVTGDHLDQEFRAAALRELAEETGLALTIDGVVPAPDGRGEDLLSSLRAAGIRLDGSALTLVSRWVTPEAAPTRFDARFYVVGADDSPEVRIDGDELVDHMWVAPGDALAMHGEGTLKMFLPTIAHLRWLERRPTVDDAVATANGADGRSLVAPRRMEDGSFMPIHLPDDE
ncbi:MAG: hypothetical protein ACRDXF_06605, partial [Acidimicrobiia bacterium]